MCNAYWTRKEKQINKENVCIELRLLLLCIVHLFWLYFPLCLIVFIHRIRSLRAHFFFLFVFATCIRIRKMQKEREKKNCTRPKCIIKHFVLVMCIYNKNDRFQMNAHKWSNPWHTRFVPTKYRICKPCSEILQKKKEKKKQHYSMFCYVNLWS